MNGPISHRMVMEIIVVKTKYSQTFINILKNSRKFVCLKVNVKSRCSSFKNTLVDHKTLNTPSVGVSSFGIIVDFSEILL